MEDPKKASFVDRLFKAGRRHSLSAVTKSSSEPTSSNPSAPIVPEPAPPARGRSGSLFSRNSSARLKGPEEKEKHEHVRESEKSMRPRSGTATGLLSRSSSRVVAEVEESYEPNPTCVEQLPKSLVKEHLSSSLAPRELMNAHFELTLRALRLAVRKEQRHYSFFKVARGGGGAGAGAGVKKDDEEEAEVENVFEDVPTEKALRRKYKVGEEIGKGAFGCVYEGKLEGKAVALKKISDLGERAAKRNRQEAYYLRRCSHDKILAVHACLRAVDTETVWLVMELLQGGSLEEAVNLAGPLPDKEVRCVCVGCSVCDALFSLGCSRVSRFAGGAALSASERLCAPRSEAGQRDAGAGRSRQQERHGEAGRLFAVLRHAARGRAAARARGGDAAVYAARDDSARAPRHAGRPVVARGHHRGAADGPHALEEPL